MSSKPQPKKVPPGVSTAAALEIQTLLLDMGFDDVDLARHNDENGKPTGGVDFRVSLDHDVQTNQVGFLDRLIVKQIGGFDVPVYELQWTLYDKKIVLAHSELASLVDKPPLDNVRSMIMRRLGRKAYTNMNSTSDSPQA